MGYLRLAQIEGINPPVVPSVEKIISGRGVCGLVSRFGGSYTCNGVKSLQPPLRVQNVEKSWNIAGRDEPGGVVRRLSASPAFFHRTKPQLSIGGLSLSNPTVYTLWYSGPGFTNSPIGRFTRLDEGPVGFRFCSNGLQYS